MSRIKLDTSDNIFEELGKNTYTFAEAVSELIDNSLSANSHGRVHIQILFNINKNTYQCDYIIIRG